MRRWISNICTLNWMSSAFQYRKVWNSHLIYAILSVLKIECSTGCTIKANGKISHFICTFVFRNIYYFVSLRVYCQKKMQFYLINKKASKEFICENICTAHISCARDRECKAICILIRFVKYNQRVLFVRVNPIGANSFFSFRFVLWKWKKKKNWAQSSRLCEQIIGRTTKHSKLSSRIFRICWRSKAFVNQSLLLFIEWVEWRKKKKRIKLILMVWLGF